MSNKRMLSEAEAWREIARRLTAPRWYRMSAGLCSFAHRLHDAEQITGQTHASMEIRANAHAMRSPERDVRSGGVFAFAPGTHRKERILAALFLALEAEDDARGAA